VAKRTRAAFATDLPRNAALDHRLRAQIFTSYVRAAADQKSITFLQPDHENIPLIVKSRRLASLFCEEKCTALGCRHPHNIVGTNVAPRIGNRFHHEDTPKCAPTAWVRGKASAHFRRRIGDDISKSSEFRRERCRARSPRRKYARWPFSRTGRQFRAPSFSHGGFHCGRSGSTEPPIYLASAGVEVNRPTGSVPRSFLAERMDNKQKRPQWRCRIGDM